MIKIQKKNLCKKKSYMERFELSKLEAPVLATGPFDHSGTRTTSCVAMCVFKLCVRTTERVQKRDL